MLPHGLLPGPHTKLVKVRALITVMGNLQSPAFLSLCKLDIGNDIQDKILKYFLIYVGYVDELTAGIMASELAALH